MIAADKKAVHSDRSDVFLNALEKDHPWSLVFESSTHDYFLVHLHQKQTHMDDFVMAQARNEFLKQRATNWKSHALLRFARVELGTATVGAIPSRPFLPIEVIPNGYRPSGVLTAALHRPHVLPSTSLPPLAQPQSLVIPIAGGDSIALGSRIIVFRLVFGRLILALQLSLVAMTGVTLGLLTGAMASNSEVGVAAAAVWIQFVQIVMASQHQRDCVRLD
ncbi:MAG: hypothetical protein Q9214_006538 [Letrouitia sp. 1 TL-2023]